MECQKKKNTASTLVADARTMTGKHIHSRPGRPSTTVTINVPKLDSEQFIWVHFPNLTASIQRVPMLNCFWFTINTRHIRQTQPCPGDPAISPAMVHELGTRGFIVFSIANTRTLCITAKIREITTNPIVLTPRSHPLPL